jgi:ATP-dependent Clp protease ATP-binding subunit ClpC
MGFSAAQAETTYDRLKEKVLEEAKKVFRPEFLNRISDLVVFRSLTRDDLVRIVDLEVEKVAKRLIERKISLEFTADAKALLIEKGYDEKLGARPLRRAVEQYLEDPLAEAILRGELHENVPVIVDRDGDKLSFNQRQPVAGATG